MSADNTMCVYITNENGNAVYYVKHCRLSDLNDYEYSGSEKEYMGEVHNIFLKEGIRFERKEVALEYAQSIPTEYGTTYLLDRREDLARQTFTVQPVGYDVTVTVPVLSKEEVFYLKENPDICFILVKNDNEHVLALDCSQEQHRFIVGLVHIRLFGARSVQEYELINQYAPWYESRQ